MDERHDMERYRDSYFEDCADLLKTKPSYKKHVNKFIFYLKEQGLSDRPKDIDLDVVDSCIGYYCQVKGELNTRSTMQAHLEALKSFYDYLVDKRKEEDIFSDYNYKKYKDKIVEKYGLAEPIERGTFSDKEIIQILRDLEEGIDEFTEEHSGVRDEDRHLQRVILRLFIKITLIAPAKRNIVTQLRVCDFEEHYKKLMINGIRINIPCGLSRDIIHAIEYTEKKNKRNIEDTDRLFEFIYRHRGNFRDESLNAWFYNMLKDFGFECINGNGKRKTYPVEPVRNTAIQMMVDNMINPVFISKISGITLSMIESTYYPEGWNLKYEEDLNKSVNKAIAQNEYYSYI